MSAATCTFTILSGSVTVPLAEPGGAFLSLSTTSMPCTTSPITVYWPSRLGASAYMMKNCEFALSTLSPRRAMPTMPRQVRPQLDHDTALGGVDHNGILLVEVGRQRLRDRGRHADQRSNNGENSDHENSGSWAMGGLVVAHVLSPGRVTVLRNGRR